MTEGVRTGAFFDEMVLTDAAGQPLNLYPTSAQKQLTDEEKLLVTRAISSTAPGMSEVHRRSDNTLVVSFVVPVDDRKGKVSALIGRARLNVNPTMTRALSGLQKTLGAGEGFVVDERGRIVLSPRAERLMTEWQPRTGQPPLAGSRRRPSLYQFRRGRNAPVDLCPPVEGYPWTAVIELPYSSVLGLAAQVSTPLLLLLLALMVVAGVVMFFVSGAVTRPVRVLSQAATRIAEGKLEEAVQVNGEGEVGQLGDVFEQMRASLKGRLDDLSLLLHVSQQVAASLDLERGIPPILEGALQTSGAFAARLVLISAEGQPSQVWRRGELPGEITPLDQRLADLARSSSSPLLVENVARVRSTLAPSIIPTGLRALAALPVRRPSETLGVLWLAYGEPRRFLESEKNVMATLAGQAAILVENAQLFQAAESERRRLAAILTSTNDAVIVTSQDGRVLLMNSAAEIAFGVVATRVVGKRLQETTLEPAVIQLLARANPDGGAQTGEVILPDGHTLYGNASDIQMGDGPSLGRVAVLRDITRFKELDSMKSDFVATVSHDLRSPLDVHARLCRHAADGWRAFRQAKRLCGKNPGRH